MHIWEFLLQLRVILVPWAKLTPLHLHLVLKIGSKWGTAGSRACVKQWEWKEAPRGMSCQFLVSAESEPRASCCFRTPGVAEEAWAQQRCPCRCLWWLCSYSWLHVQTEEQPSLCPIGPVRNTLGWPSTATMQPALWYSCLCTSVSPSPYPWVLIDMSFSGLRLHQTIWHVSKSDREWLSPPSCRTHHPFLIPYLKATFQNQEWKHFCTWNPSHKILAPHAGTTTGCAPQGRRPQEQNCRSTSHPLHWSQ